MSKAKALYDLLSRVKKLARRYRDLTGKPLGVTGEIAEYEAARLLRLELTPARNAGYDAIRKHDGRRLQIKGRCILSGKKRSQKLGRIDVRKKFDGVLLVLLDEDFDALEIYEADRRPVVTALRRKGSRARNERGQLAAGAFKGLAGKFGSDEAARVSVRPPLHAVFNLAAAAPCR